MLELIENKDYETLIYFIAIRVIIILVCWLFMVLSCIVDFWSGTKTAKVLGQRLMSHGFRRTVQKIGDYVRLMFFALMFDVLGSLLPFYVAPYATMLCTVAVMSIEGKSVLENSKRKKSHAAEIPKIVKAIVEATTTEQVHEILEQVSKMLAMKDKEK